MCFTEPGCKDIISVVRGMYRKDGLSVLARGSRCGCELTYVSTFCQIWEDACIFIEVEF